MTYGEVRFQITVQFPGISLDLIDQWIQNRYQQILDALPWQRLEKETVIQTVASYATGTLAATQGSTAVTGTGTTWTAAMTGRMIRIADRSEFYTFTRTGDTTGTLDRGYEGDTGTGLSYRIDQNIFALPDGLLILKGVAPLDGTAPLEVMSLARLNAIAPGRRTYGAPSYAALYMDDASTPPKPQVELHPVPESLAGMRVHYQADATPPSETSVALLPWIRPGCLLAGVQADARDHLKEYAGSDRAEARFGRLLTQMLATECRRRGPVQIKMASRLTRHWQNASLRRTRGFTL